MLSRFVRRFLLSLLLAAWAVDAWSVDIPDVLPAAFSQPQINALFQYSPTGAPISEPDYGSFNVTGYFDTGASGILLSNATADQLQLAKSQYPAGTGPQVIYEDVGVGGSDSFWVSEPLHMRLAKFEPSVDVDNILTYETVYTQTVGPVRIQIGPTSGDDPDLGGFDVIGVSSMKGKVVVMDPKPIDVLLTDPSGENGGDMNTYVYGPHTPFNPATADSEPGIPTTNRHIRLSYGAFDRFTRVTPTGAPGPTLGGNPFIGPDPVARLAGATNDTTPGITLSFAGVQTTGSFLFDTGAATSMVSKSMAAKLHVRYVPGTEGTDTPQLELFDPAHPDLPGTLLTSQFVLPVGGIGGSVNAAGFYVDSMLLRTMEGDPSNALDPNHLRFTGAPVLVSDITVQDPTTLQTLTLDGVFGMNYLVASGMPDLSDMSTGNFNWAVFDQPNGILGLDYKGTLPTNFSIWNADGTAGTNWSTGANWENGAPTVGDALRFAQAGGTSTANYNDFPAGTHFGGIVFSGTASFNLQGNSVGLWGNVVNLSPATQTIGLDLILGGAPRTFNADSGNIAVTGRISGDQGLIKTGSYKLVLSGSNSYTGGTTVASGVLVISAATALSAGQSLVIGDLIGADPSLASEELIPAPMNSVAAASESGYVSDVGTATSAVPEPGTISLLLCAATGSVALRKRRAKRGCRSKPALQ